MEIIILVFTLLLFIANHIVVKYDMKNPDCVKDEMNEEEK